MKTAINTWVLNPTLPLKDKFVLVKKAGFDAIEINFEEDCPNSILSWHSMESDLKQIRHVFQEEVLEVSSICSELHWKYPLSANDKQERKKAIEAAKRMLEQASAHYRANSIVAIPGIICVPVCLREKRTKQTLLYGNGFVKV